MQPCLNSGSFPEACPTAVGCGLKFIQSSADLRAKLLLFVQNVLQQSKPAEPQQLGWELQHWVLGLLMDFVTCAENRSTNLQSMEQVLLEASELLSEVLFQ